MSMDELIRLFDLHRCSKSGAKFDYKKGIWFNHTYIQQKSDKEIAELFVPEKLKEHGVEAPYKSGDGGWYDERPCQLSLKNYGRYAVSSLWLRRNMTKRRLRNAGKRPAKCMTELAEVLAGIEDFSIEGQEK